MSCDEKTTSYKKFCHQCGTTLDSKQAVCTNCGVATAGVTWTFWAASMPNDVSQ